MNQAEERAQFVEAMNNLTSGTYKAQGDLIDFTLYDSMYVDNATPTLNQQLFVNGLGQTDPVTGNRKVLSDTNMRGRVGIPQGQKLMVKFIKTFYHFETVDADGTTLLAFYDMLAETTVNIRIEGKDTYGVWGLDEMLNFPISNASTGATQISTQGKAVGVYPLELPIVLASLTSFELTITHDVAPAAALQDDKLKIGLCGVLGRLS